LSISRLCIFKVSARFPNDSSGSSIIDHRSSFTRLGEIFPVERRTLRPNRTHRFIEQAIHRYVVAATSRARSRGEDIKSGRGSSFDLNARCFSPLRGRSAIRRSSRTIAIAHRSSQAARIRRRNASKRVRRIPRKNGRSSIRRPQFVFLSFFLSPLPTEKLRVTTNAASRTQCSLISLDVLQRRHTRVDSAD